MDATPTRHRGGLSRLGCRVLANGVSAASRPELAQAYGDEYSTEAVLRVMAEAVEAGGRIPEEMSAGEAAETFCRYELRHLREAHERATGTKMERPGWLTDG